ncbi:PorV/PorQ family protein [candidate division KSB1 bacterium]
MRNRILLVSFLLIATTSLYSQAPKYSNEFLAIGVGARALGMSNAVSSFVQDVTAGYWNPAGLVEVKYPRQLALMHSEYFAGIAKYDYAALSAKIDNSSALGFSIIRFAVDDIPNTTELIDNEGNINYDRITSFSAADYGFILSYARKHKNEKLRYGINVKIIHRKIGDFATAWGFGLDIGTQYQQNNWVFGITGKDITSTFNAWNFNLSDKTKEVFTLTENEIPENSLEITLPRLIIGIGRRVNISEKFSTLIAMDLDLTTDGKRNVFIKSDPFSIDPHLGIEISFKDIFFLRGGVGNLQEETDFGGKKTTTFQPNMGIGVNIKDLVIIDYALTDIGDNSVAVYSNVFSLKLNIKRNE